MLNKTLVISVFLAALAGCATAPQPHQGNTAANANCAAPSGNATRIPARPDNCPPGQRSYSGEQLQQTGAQTAAGGLSLLDPDITISHH
jgi:hypothetical protein